MKAALSVNCLTNNSDPNAAGKFDMIVPSNHDPKDTHDRIKDKLEEGIRHTWQIVWETLEV